MQSIAPARRSDLRECDPVRARAAPDSGEHDMLQSPCGMSTPYRPVRRRARPGLPAAAPAPASTAAGPAPPGAPGRGAPGRWDGAAARARRGAPAPRHGPGEAAARPVAAGPPGRPPGARGTLPRTRPGECRLEGFGPWLLDAARD